MIRIRQVKHLTFMYKILSLIFDRYGRMKILLCMILDAAYNYHINLGFIIPSNLINSKTNSFEDSCKIAYEFNNNNKVNLVVFVLNIILTYTGKNYDELLNNELNKISEVCSLYKTLCFYDK